jgi:hypothetical protein
MGIKIIYNTIIGCIKQCIYTYVLKSFRTIRRRSGTTKGRLITLVITLIMINRLVAPDQLVGRPENFVKHYALRSDPHAELVPRLTTDRKSRNI